MRHSQSTVFREYLCTFFQSVIFHKTTSELTMASPVPNITLNNGLSIPQLGLGTWNSPPGEVSQAVKDAIDIGYRHIDCAYVYGNEAEVGEGISAKISEGVVKREDLFITSKLWNTFHRPDLVVPALKKTLENLKTPYLDLYLIHWPFAYKEEGDLFPKDENDKLQFSDVDFVDTWKAMEEAVDLGLVKSIGISNFNVAQTKRLLESCRIKPVTNQVECHPYLTQIPLSTFLKSVDIVLTAYSPLGSPARPWVTKDDPVLLEDPKILAIAAKYNKNAAQILIRYQLQRGHVVIPKSVTKGRIASNFNVFDFELTQGDIDEINTFECNGRICPMAGALGHPFHPFEKDEF
ncbi:aldo-keto reductase family 1 member B1-like isoform X4 [Sitodiplosis mosellana]|uniref:aldo-keto reductase family 1 member B1-like isoform X4 n=1 Tax=Sitodiplosis mosellana TaxID=263140 RepID=UPI00244381C7|nr:aldo-keto reductase family 1 member B1-like isoform X4 [Sitodiplosis mosellana]